MLILVLPRTQLTQETISYQILELMRKTILSASIIYLQESATRIIIGIFVCGMYLLYITYNQPQLKNNDAFLSILSATEIFLLLF